MTPTSFHSKYIYFMAENVLYLLTIMLLSFKLPIFSKIFVSKKNADMFLLSLPFHSSKLVNFIENWFSEKENHKFSSTKILLHFLKTIEKVDQIKLITTYISYDSRNGLILKFLNEGKNYITNSICHNSYCRRHRSVTYNSHTYNSNVWIKYVLFTVVNWIN